MARDVNDDGEEQTCRQTRTDVGVSGSSVLQTDAGCHHPEDDDGAKCWDEDPGNDAENVGVYG